MHSVDEATDFTQWEHRIQEPTDTDVQIRHLEQQIDTALAIRDLTPSDGPTPIDADTVNRIRHLSRDELMEYASDTLELIDAIRAAA